MQNCYFHREPKIWSPECNFVSHILQWKWKRIVLNNNPDLIPIWSEVSKGIKSIHSDWGTVATTVCLVSLHQAHTETLHASKQERCLQSWNTGHRSLQSVVTEFSSTTPAQRSNTQLWMVTPLGCHNNLISASTHQEIAGKDTAVDGNVPLISFNTHCPQAAGAERRYEQQLRRGGRQ